MFIIILLILIVALWIFFYQASNLVSAIFGSPYVNLDKKVIKRAIELSELKKGEIFYDLGCGSGESLNIASGSGAKAIGFEVSPWPYLIAKIKTLFTKNTTVKLLNIFRVDLSEADVIYCYLLPSLIAKLENKVKTELKSQTRIVSVDFPFNYLKLKKSEKLGIHTIYLY